VGRSSEIRLDLGREGRAGNRQASDGDRDGDAHRQAIAACGRDLSRPRTLHTAPQTARAPPFCQ
jgi:hypothetical protein